jgi:hypothetical protein
MILKSSKYIYSVLIFFLLSQAAIAQRFGGNPPGMKWHKAKGNSVDLIYPLSLKREAQRVLGISESLSSGSAFSLGTAVQKAPIVLQGLPIVSNAYVGLGPWRSEFFLYPPQNALELGSTSWLDNLAYHEYRHIHQYSNFRKGLSKFAYWVAGEQGQALANAASIPDWFFEGDAVFYETLHLGQGRGRLPGFFDPFRSIWQANKTYSYQKLRSGSLKDFVPNHYDLGYLLVAYGYKKYGQDFWGKVTNDAVRFKGLTYPFQKAIRRHSGLAYRQFVAHALDSFRMANLAGFENESIKPINKVDTRRVVDHYFPVWMGGDSILSLRKPYNQQPHWSIFSKGKWYKLVIKDISSEDYFTYKRGNIVYTAYDPDPRWQWKEFSEIRMFNVCDRSTRTLTQRGRFASPDLSHDGDKLVAVEVLPGGKSQLVLLNTLDGAIQKKFKFAEEDFYSYPVFSSDDLFIYVIARKPDGSSSILSFDQATGASKPLFPFVKAPLSFLRVRGNSLLFTISQGNANELREIDLTSGLSKVLSRRLTGSYGGDLHEDQNKIVYGSPTAEGQQLFVRDLSMTSQDAGNSPLHDIVSSPLFSSAVKVAASTADDSFPLEQRSISSLHAPVNLHSWRPFYEQPEWSFTLYGENVLNTVQSQFSYVYNENEGSHRVGADFAVGTLYPWITGGTNYTMDRSFKDATREFQWNEWNGNLGLRLPLNFSFGKWYRNLDLSVRLNGVSLDYQNKNNVSPADRFVTYWQQQISWSMQTQQALQQIYPRYALVTRIQNRTALGNTQAHQLFYSANAFLPGLGRTHSTVLGFHYQRRDTLGQYNYSNGMPMARGYEPFNYPRMWRYSLNYHFPLFYPDKGIGNMVYFLRVRGNAFYDDMTLKSLRTGRKINLRSAGMEIYFDTKWWNQQSVSFGVRYSRLLDTDLFVQKPNPNRFEFIMPLNLFPD